MENIVCRNKSNSSSSEEPFHSIIVLECKYYDKLRMKLTPDYDKGGTMAALIGQLLNAKLKLIIYHCSI